MAERFTSVWGYRLLFVGLCALIGLVQILPLNTGPDEIPGPDVILLIAFSWTVMRPDLLPIWLLALCLLAADLFLMRPPGLWTALAVVGAEFLRSRRVVFRNTPFFVEWLIVAAVILVMTLVNAVILGIFGVEQPTIMSTLIRLVFTVMVYPLVVILAGRAFGLKKPDGLSESILGMR